MVFFQPIWKICSSNWIISPGRDGNKKYLKQPTSESLYPCLFLLWLIGCLINKNLFLLIFCWFGYCRCSWKNAGDVKMQKMSWRNLWSMWFLVVKLISSSKCSSVSCCFFYGCWGAFCINHLAIARTKKNTHYLTDLAQRWPICKIKLTSQLSVFTSWIGKCFPNFFRGETRTQGVLAFQILGGHHCWSLFLNYTH